MSPLGGKKSPPSGAPGLRAYWEQFTYFGYFGRVYPRKRKGHQISDHLIGE